jgi:ABC-type multidrug transport system ATPase subunit
VLAGRIGPGNLTGTILLDGYKRNKKNWQRDCAYVEQDDLLHATLTVQETLDYSAKFRLHDGCTLAERQEKVNEVIMDLGLNGCRNSFIGNENIRGVSGGERKRVSIGQELLTTPHILFLDEPTSGLDAFTSFNIINTMKQIAVKRNKIVIMTIHQPRTDIINLIDKVLLLSSGKTMWLGSTKDALVHFSSLGYVIPPKTNPSDFFMDTLTLDQRDPEKLAASKARVDNSKVAWDIYYKKQTATEATFPTMSSTISIATPAKNPFKELRTLLGRDFLLISRNTSPMKVLFFQSIGIIVIFD